MHLYTHIAVASVLCRAVLVTLVKGERLPTPKASPLACLHRPSERKLILTLIQQTVESVSAIKRSRGGVAEVVTWAGTMLMGLGSRSPGSLGLAGQR